MFRTITEEEKKKLLYDLDGSRMENELRLSRAKSDPEPDALKIDRYTKEVEKYKRKLEFAEKSKIYRCEFCNFKSKDMLSSCPKCKDSQPSIFQKIIWIFSSPKDDF